MINVESYKKEYVKHVELVLDLLSEILRSTENVDRYSRIYVVQANHYFLLIKDKLNKLSEINFKQLNSMILAGCVLLLDSWHAVRGIRKASILLEVLCDMVSFKKTFINNYKRESGSDESTLYYSSNDNAYSHINKIKILENSYSISLLEKQINNFIFDNGYALVGVSIAGSGKNHYALVTYREPVENQCNCVADYKKDWDC